MTARPDYILHEILVSEWTEEEGYLHLRGTFDRACRDFPDVMESYLVMLVDLGDTDAATQKSLMRRALRETLDRRRYPPLTKLATTETTPC